MMNTEETSMYRHEINKFMNFDESNLKVYPQLDSCIKTKYLGAHFNLIDVARLKEQKIRSTAPNFRIPDPSDVYRNLQP